MSNDFHQAAFGLVVCALEHHQSLDKVVGVLVGDSRKRNFALSMIAVARHAGRNSLVCAASLEDQLAGL